MNFTHFKEFMEKFHRFIHNLFQKQWTFVMHNRCSLRAKTFFNLLLTNWNLSPRKCSIKITHSFNFDILNEENALYRWGNKQQNLPHYEIAIFHTYSLLSSDWSSNSKLQMLKFNYRKTKYLSANFRHTSCQIINSAYILNLANSFDFEISRI